MWIERLEEAVTFGISVIVFLLIGVGVASFGMTVWGLIFG